MTQITETNTSLSPAKPKRIRRFFSNQDKLKAVDRTRQGESYATVSNDLKIHKNLLRLWMTKLGATPGDLVIQREPKVPSDLTQYDYPSLQAVRQLEAELAELKEEVEFYKRTAHLYSKQSESTRRSEISSLQRTGS